MKQFITLGLLLLSMLSTSAQLAPDFTVTDTDGIEHTLYEDHLNNGQTVVIELFFVACPPCQSAAPGVEAVYQMWGAGEYDVEFIKLTTQNGDDDEDVSWFKSTFGTTFPGVSAEGGAAEARTPYRNGTFGPFFGTPQFSVIAPDGTVNHGVPLNGLSAAIAATGAQGMGTAEPEFTTYRMLYSTPSNSSPESVSYILSGDGPDQYNITALTNGSTQFSYPSDIFPQVSNPRVTMQVAGPALNSSIRPADLLTIVRHILDISPLITPAQLAAADVNGDGQIKPADLLVLQRLLLELATEFPNDTPTWKVLENEIPLLPNVGNVVDLHFEIVKTGDANH